MKTYNTLRVTWLYIAKTIAIAAPAISILLLIVIYGSDIPYQDQLDGVPVLLDKMNSGTLGLSDFFAQHNEHRIFFPRLLMFSLALLTHWNLRIELFVSWLLACICALNLWRLSRVTGWGASNERYWLLFASNVLLFTPLNWHNWLWGFQIGFFLPLTAITALLWIVPSTRTEISFLAAIVLSMVVNFSIASGFACWIIALLLLLFPRGTFKWRGQRGWLMLFLLAFAACQFLYAWGYKVPSQHPSPLLVLHRPWDALVYILAYFGSAFAWGTVLDSVLVAGVIGGILVLLFATSAAYIFARRRDSSLVARSLPWLALCFFVLAMNVVTMIGRLGFGTDQALASRYVLFSVMFVIGIIFLVRLSFNRWRSEAASKRSIATLTTGSISIAAILSGLLLVSSVATFRMWSGYRLGRLRAGALLELINVVDDPEDFAKYVYPSPGEPSMERKRIVTLMGSLGYLRPHLISAKYIREIAVPTSPAQQPCGFVDNISMVLDGKYAISGWAVLSKKREAAISTLLTYDDDNAQPVICAIAFTDTPRPDVVNAWKRNSYLNCGWHATISRKEVPAGRRTIRAWAFDSECCKAYELDGTKTVLVFGE
jgi:hypothetical protein